MHPLGHAMDGKRGFSWAFWPFWWGHTLGLFGDVLFSAGMMWFVYRATGSALATAGVPLMDTAARILGGLLAGPLADRRARALWMGEIHLAKTALVVTTALLLTRQALTPWVVYALTFLLVVLSALYEPAYGALLPDLVRPRVLARSNAFLQASRTLAHGLSWALSGLSLERFGPVPLAWANVAAFGLAAATFLVLHRLRPRAPAVAWRASSPRIFLRDLWAGVAEYRRSRVLRGLLAVSVPGWLTYGLWGPLMLVYLDRVLHMGAAGWGWSQALFFLTGLAGSGLAAWWLGRLGWREGQWVVRVAAFHGLLTLAFGLAPSYGWALVTVGLAGVTDPFFLSARQALLQHSVTDDLRGRVLAVWNMATSLGAMLSFLLMGGLGEVVPLRGLYSGMGVLYLAGVLLAARVYGLERAEVGET